MMSVTDILCRMRHDVGYAFMVADVSKKFVPRRANFVLPPAPHCFQADFPSGCDLLLSHHGIVHFCLLGKCHHDNAVRRRSQALCSEPPGIITL